LSITALLTFVKTIRTEWVSAEQAQSGTQVVAATKVTIESENIKNKNKLAKNILKFKLVFLDCFFVGILLI